MRGSKPWMRRELFVQDDSVHQCEYSRQSDEDKLGCANLKHRSQDDGHTKDNAPNGNHGRFGRTDSQGSKRHHQIEEAASTAICHAEWKSRIFWSPWVTFALSAA